MNYKTKTVILKKCPSFLFKPGYAVFRGFRVFKHKAFSFIFRKKMKYYCPCCNTHVREFVVADYTKTTNKFNPTRYTNTKQNVLCPACKALPRHRILASWCETKLSLLQTSKILYFAPEYSMTRWMKKNGVKYTTADLFAEADLKIDIQDTGLPDESYDVVVCNHVLEHVDDFRKALREMYRILRKGGKLICSFPMDPKVELLDEDPSVDTEEGRLARFGQNDHKRVFGMKADQFLQEAGFKVTPICGEDYPEEILPVVGPADYDMNRLFVCEKGTI